MSQSIRITIAASLEDSELVHRIFNFKEDLYRGCLNTGQAEIIELDAIDIALKPLSIRLRSKRSLGPVAKFIRAAVEENNLAGIVTAWRGDREWIACAPK